MLDAIALQSLAGYLPKALEAYSSFPSLPTRFLPTNLSWEAK